MAAKTKIKILDDQALRDILEGAYEAASQVQLCQYALSLAEHILAAVGYENPGHPAIQAGFTVNRRWQRGEVRMHEVRLAGFEIHRLARNSQDILTRTALRVAGQAVAAGHMREHAMVASDYAVKAINLLLPGDREAVRRERQWQIARLQACMEA